MFEHSNYNGLVEYPASTSPAMPTLGRRASDLLSIWPPTSSPIGLASSSYSYTKTSVACPTSEQHWNLTDNFLPTIDGLVISIVSSATATQGPGASDSASTNKPANQDVSSGLSQGGKIGLGVGIGSGALIIGTAVWFLWSRRPKRKNDPTEPDQVVAPDLVPAGSNEAKPELYGGAFDPAVAGPVFPKQELPTGDVIQGSPGPKVEGFSPPELYSTELLEAGTATYRHEASEEGSSTAVLTASSSNNRNIQHHQPVWGPFQDMHSTPGMGNEERAESLARQADVLVQELSLITVRKRGLANNAQAAESLRDADADAYQELLQQERRVRERLDEIHSQR